MHDVPARTFCLLFYLAAFLSLLFDWPAVIEAVLQYGTLLLLLAHAVEVVVAWRWVRLYEGPILLSILYTLLFGIVHWRPLKHRAARNRSG